MRWELVYATPALAATTGFRTCRLLEEDQGTGTWHYAVCVGPMVEQGTFVITVTLCKHMRAGELKALPEPFTSFIGGTRVQGHTVQR